LGLLPRSLPLVCLLSVPAVPAAGRQLHNCLHSLPCLTDAAPACLPAPRLLPARLPQILAGAVVSSGELDAEVTAIGADTFFGKTMALLGAPEERGHLQTVGYVVNPGCQLQSVVGVADRGGWGWGLPLHPATLQNLICHPWGPPASTANAKAPSKCIVRRLLPPPVAPQVLGRVSAALGLLGAAGCLAILGVIIARYGDVGYAFVVRRRFSHALPRACMQSAMLACDGILPACPPARLPPLPASALAEPPAGKHIPEFAAHVKPALSRCQYPPAPPPAPPACCRSLL
jgi:hypothetical protein